MRVRPLLLLVTLTLLLPPATPASADVTAFIGAATTEGTHQARGFAAGAGLLVIGFEFEYSDIVEDVAEDAPSLRTGMANVLVQNPVPIAGLQFYFTTGAGVYRERLGAVHQETHVGGNVGGGVKITLAGPLRLRLDYRVLTLRGSPRVARPQRVYAGLNLAF